jgi:hypothetical protein
VNLLPEIEVFNYSESKYMRLDSKDVLKALKENSSSELIYDYSIGAYRHLDSKDLRKIMKSTVSSELVMEYGKGNIHIDAKHFRNAVEKIIEK